MRLDNRGWGLIPMLVIVAVFIVAAFISHTIYVSTFGPNGIVDLSNINNTFVSNSVDFDGYEEDMRTSANLYVKENDIIISNGEKFTISLSELIKKSYLKALTVSNTNCTGYVNVNALGSKPYLNCPGYITPGYVNELDD